MKYIYKVSYMSAHVLLNLLNELGKTDKMQGLQSILSFFHSKLNKFNKTRAQMLDSIYYMKLRLPWYLISAVKSVIIRLWTYLLTKFCHYVHKVVMDVITSPENMLTTSGLLILLHGIISLPDATSYDKKIVTELLQLYFLNHTFRFLCYKSF